MEVTASLSSASDDDSYDYSTGPVTPDLSPLIRPTSSSFIIDKQHRQSFEGFTIGGSPSSEKPEEIDLCPRAKAQGVRNVCFIGAGYVGEPERRPYRSQDP